MELPGAVAGHDPCETVEGMEADHDQVYQRLRAALKEAEGSRSIKAALDICFQGQQPPAHILNLLLDELARVPLHYPFHIYLQGGIFE